MIDKLQAIDMSQNRVPYGLLTDEEKAALHEHEKAGGTFEFTLYGQLWEKTTRFHRCTDCIYRTVPLPLTQDEIAWDRLPDWAEWVARDDDGEVLGHWLEPNISRDSTWCARGERRRIDDFPGIVIKRGTCDWKDSKQRRPQK
jgi:hypothetical protein